MKLLTKELERVFPPLYSTEEVALVEKPVICKFFTPDANWTWYAVEASYISRNEDGDEVHHRLSEKPPEYEDVLFFGYVDGTYPEWGYFTLNQLREVRGVFGLPVERDRGFKVGTLASTVIH